MGVADVVAKRSHCVRRQAGTVIVDKDNRIVATGYNGPPAGYSTDGPCDQWCERAKTGGATNAYDDCTSTHSEINALIYADRSRMEDGTIYVTSTPCFTCAKAVANSGVRQVICRIGPEDALRAPERSIEFMRQCGLTVVVLT